MNSNFQQGPFLREQRKFPNDTKEISEQLDQAYIDIAQKVNARTIGIYSDNKMIVTGESWYLKGEPNRQQTLRQVYIFSDNTAPLTYKIPHKIDFASVSAFTKIYGTFTDNSKYYPLPWVDTTNVNNQVRIYVDATNIRIDGGGGTNQPSLRNGIVVLEWLSQK